MSALTPEEQSTLSSLLRKLGRAAESGEEASG
jgi:hypothetical protein